MRRQIALPIHHPLIDMFERKMFDWSYHPIVRAFVSCSLLGMSYLVRIYDPCRSFYLLLAAHRLVKKGFWAKIEVPVIKRRCGLWYEHWGTASVSRKVTLTDLKLFRMRSLVLKPPIQHPEGLEKGVLLVAGHFRELICLTDMEKLLRDYWLVLEPASAGYADPNILYFTSLPQYPVLVMTPAIEDREFLGALKSNLIPISLGAGDWVNPSIFKPLPRVQKEYDAVMVAYWGRVKRHHVLFKAVRSLEDSTYRVALVGVPWDEGSLEKIRSLASWYGVDNQITFYEKLKPHEVNEVLNKSKVNLLLSLKEGANRTLFEGMFANVPAILLRSNIGVNKEHIVEGVTGCLASEKELPSKLKWFRDHFHKFSPRSWAMQHISPEVSTAKLNTFLKELALSAGELWTRDIVAKCNAPEPVYYPDNFVADGFPTIEDILRTYGRGNRAQDEV